MKEIAANHEAPAPYSGYDVLAKWNTTSFDDATRKVLARRLNELPPRRFFSQDMLSLLEAIVERLMPPLPGLSAQRLARGVDDRLTKNIGEGFRGVDTPPLQRCWRMGLAAIDGEAHRLRAAPFVALPPDDRDKILRAVHAGEADVALWHGLDPATFFSDTLLKMVSGLAYAHPLSWNDIGFGGPASPRGYVRLGFDARDPWEAKKRR